MNQTTYNTYILKAREKGKCVKFTYKDKSQEVIKVLPIKDLGSLPQKQNNHSVAHDEHLYQLKPEPKFPIEEILEVELVNC